MKEYLKMSDVFLDEMRVIGDSKNMLADDVGIIIGCYSGDKMAEYVLHAINSHDELVAMNKELLEALERLLSDMRLRAKLDGDVDSNGCVVLNCGNGVLYAANKAIAKAKGIDHE